MQRTYQGLNIGIFTGPHHQTQEGVGLEKKIISSTLFACRKMKRKTCDPGRFLNLFLAPYHSGHLLTLKRTTISLNFEGWITNLQMDNAGSPPLKRWIDSKLATDCSWRGLFLDSLYFIKTLSTPS